jgi:hypothetical protein
MRPDASSDSPDETLVTTAIVIADRRQRYVDDHGIEHDDELRRRKEGERDPFAPRRQLGFGHGWTPWVSPLT